MLLPLLLLACRPSNALPERGAWILDGPELRGTLSSEDGCRIALWGPTFTTGEEPVRCEAVREESGELWLFFELISGAGAGDAAALLAGDTLTLPLGARPGELELHLTRSPGTLEASELSRLAAEAKARVDAENTAWIQGYFRLLDGERLVGELSVPADGVSEIAVYDALWMTAGVEDATRAQEGPDLLFTFPIMPSLNGELGLLRLNRLTREVVIPLGPDPHPADRHLRAEAGRVSEEERGEAMKRALDEGAARELRVSPELARQLAIEAADGGCEPDIALEERWTLPLRGYRVTVRQGEAGCEVLIAPQVVQHGRRVKARIGPEGVRELVVMPVL